MDKFNYLIRRRQGALSLFSKVCRKLLELEVEITDLMSYSAHKIDEAKEVIGTERQQTQYLADELAKTAEQRKKIEALL